jgi:hypothetical protein
MVNAVEWASQEPPPVRVTGPGVLDLAVWRQQNSLTVHLVNLTNPMMMKGPYREILPLAGQRLTLPLAARPAAVHLLVSKAKLDWEWRGGAVRAELPPIGLHEVVAVDLAG